MPVTLKDIARKVGYSVTTVSRALAGYDDVAQSTRQLILDTAAEMGYHPDATGRRLDDETLRRFFHDDGLLSALRLRRHASRPFDRLPGG